MLAEVEEDGRRDRARCPGGVVGEYFVGEETILLAIQGRDQFPDGLDGGQVHVEEYRKLPRGLGILSEIKQLPCHAQRPKVPIGYGLQSLPGLRQSDGLASCGTVPDSGPVLDADDDRVSFGP